MQLKGRTAIVTGAAGALGRAIVDMLKAEGASRIVALDVRELQSDDVIQSLKCDLSDSAAVEALLVPLLDDIDVDILINNVGILHSAPLANLLNKNEDRFRQAAEAWDRVMRVNLSSAFYVSQIVADHMLRRRIRGVIVNMSSVSARGTPGQSAYSASKAGLEVLTKLWAKELGVMGIRVAGVAPGYMDTPSTHEVVEESKLADITSRIPLKRLGEQGQVAQAVKFVLENEYMSGQVLAVDGGYRP